jgi:hypothetical protein
MRKQILSRGIETSIVTERGTEVQVRYVIAELATLVASHDSMLRVNKKYPAILQPRDRARIASEDQVNRIANGLRPELLAGSPKASDGALIIGPDMIVESGNARAVALSRVYARGPAAAKPYRNYLLKIASALKLDKNEIRNAKAPVLVRLRLSDVNRFQFVRECNEQAVAALSASEQARIDADRLDAGMLSLFEPDEAGNLGAASNRDFIRAFVDRAIAPIERGRYMDSHGSISQEGLRRIQNAVCAKAYGEDSMIERLAEATEDNVKRISLALIKKAGQFASLKIAIRDDARYDRDLTPHLARAMRKLSALRDAGHTVNDYLKQGVLCGEDLIPLERRILEVFEKHKLSSRAIEDVLGNFIVKVEGLGHPDQISMLADRPLPSMAELFEDAVSTIPRSRPVSRAARLKKVKPRPIRSKSTWDRAAAARRAWITIRANRLAAKAA